jgi:hypothetical protein
MEISLGTSYVPEYNRTTLAGILLLRFGGRENETYL